MYSLEYIDESVIETCKKNFSRIYPEFRPVVIGVSKDRTCVIIECEFPDGIFYFRVDEHSVSSSYNTAEDADRA